MLNNSGQANSGNNKSMNEESKFVNSKLAKSFRIDFKLTTDDVDEVLKKH